MAISKKIAAFMEKGSWIRKMFEEGAVLKKKVGEENVFDFSLGNPVIEPPEAFKEALKRAAASEAGGLHRYMPNAGYPAVREAVAEHLKSEVGLAFGADQIIMTVGAGGALNVILKTVLDPGDEVLVLSPYFVEYLFYVDNHGGVAMVVETNEDFSLNLESIEKAMTPKTKGLIVNSPNNPTGVIYSRESIAALGELLSRKQREFNRDIYLVSDEPYRRIVFDGAEYPSIFAHYDNSIVATSHSKDLSIPGERIGYVAVSPRASEGKALASGMTFCNRTLGYVNAPALMQRVVGELQSISVDPMIYQRKRDLLYGSLKAMGYWMVKPQGAFYVFPRSPIADDVAFVRELQKRNILTTPGIGFGRGGYFRISFCVEDRTIERALAGFEEVARQFGLARD